MSATELLPSVCASAAPSAGLEMRRLVHPALARHHLPGGKADHDDGGPRAFRKKPPESEIPVFKLGILNGEECDLILGSQLLFKRCEIDAVKEERISHYKHGGLLIRGAGREGLGGGEVLIDAALDAADARKAQARDNFEGAAIKEQSRQQDGDSAGGGAQIRIGSRGRH